MIGLVAAGSALPGTAAADESMEQLQRDWWQWAMSIPASHHPIYDKTGNRCGIAQRGDVWFLAGSTGGKVTRTCTVPEDVRLLVPVVNTFCFPDASLDDAACVQDTDNFMASFTPGTLYLEVDGHPQTPVIGDDLVRSEDDFNFAVDANGFGGTKPGVYRATIASGYWALLPGLSQGPHVIKIQVAGPMFAFAVTYNLEVVEPGN
jgi:hypothetical protein